jgi:hypothetical protein
MTFGKACGSLSERCYDLLAEFSVAGSFLHVHPCWNSTRLCLRWCGVDLSPRPSFLKNWNPSGLSLLHLDGHMLYVILSFRVTLFFSWHDVKYYRAEILLTWQACKILPGDLVSHFIVVFILDITICSIQLGLVGCFGHLKVGGSLGWRSAFWIESLLMLPFAIFGFMSKRIHLKGATQVLHLPSYCTLLCFKAFQITFE